VSGPLVGEVLEKSRARWTARLVQIVLAERVNEKRVEVGEPPLAWPSQADIAKRAGGIDARTVRRHLAELERLGEIEDTGQRKGRGVKVWEVVPGGRTQVSRVDTEARGERAETAETPEPRTATPGRADASVHPGGHLRPVGRTGVSREPEVESEVESEVGTGTAADAAAMLSTSTSTSQVEERAQAIEELRAALRGSLEPKARAMAEHALGELEAGEVAA
jgi:hypothetical protein